VGTTEGSINALIGLTDVNDRAQRRHDTGSEDPCCQTTEAACTFSEIHFGSNNERPATRRYPTCLSVKPNFYKMVKFCSHLTYKSKKFVAHMLNKNKRVMTEKIVSKFYYCFSIHSWWNRSRATTSNMCSAHQADNLLCILVLQQHPICSPECIRATSDMDDLDSLGGSTDDQ
jgi:hypothetical protein